MGFDTSCYPEMQPKRWGHDWVLKNLKEVCTVIKMGESGVNYNMYRQLCANASEQENMHTKQDDFYSSLVPKSSPTSTPQQSLLENFTIIRKDYSLSVLHRLTINLVDFSNGNQSILRKLSLLLP